MQNDNESAGNSTLFLDSQYGNKDCGDSLRPVRATRT